MHENLVMYLNTRKSSLNFGTHTDIEQNLGFFEETFTVVDGENHFAVDKFLRNFRSGGMSGNPQTCDFGADRDRDRDQETGILTQFYH